MQEIVKVLINQEVRQACPLSQTL